MYIACQLGIVFMIIMKKHGNLLCPSGIYNHENISSLAINKKYIFLGTNSGLLRLEKRKQGFLENMIMNFLKEINDLA